MAEMRELDQLHVGLEIDPQINRIVRQLQVAFLEEVPQKFHQFILRECLVGPNDVRTETRGHVLDIISSFAIDVKVRH